MGRATNQHADSLVQWVKPLGRAGMQGAEVGVHRGVLSEELLRQVPELYLWMVDSWTASAPDSSYAQSRDNSARLSQADHLSNLQESYERTSFAADRRALVRTDSCVAAAAIAAESLDFVFLDADHSYEAVQKDIIAWWPKVRPGGFLAGHDYGAKWNFNGRWGVNKAVDEFVSQQKLKLILAPGTVWGIRKPGLDGHKLESIPLVKVVRVVYGDLPSNVPLQREIDASFSDSWAREDVIHFVAGSDSRTWLTDRGAQCVELVQPEPSLPCIAKYGHWFMKTLLISAAVEKFGEVLYLDFDCRCLRPPDDAMSERLRKTRSSQNGGSLQGLNVGYRNPICLHRDRRKHPVRRCLSGCMIYCSDPQWMRRWLSAYDEGVRLGLSADRISDETMLMLAIDKKCGVLDEATMMASFELMIATSRRNRPDAKQMKAGMDMYFYHR